MNKIVDVAKLLGVEIGEEFEASKKGRNLGALYKITNNRLLWFDEYYKGWKCAKCLSIEDLLFDEEYEIIKKPFKPKFGQIYYYVCYSNKKFNIESGANYYSHYDILNAGINNQFRTRQEAEQNKQIIIDLLSPYIVEGANE